MIIGTIHNLNVTHLQASIEAKRELESTSQKLTLQIDREKASKAELKTQLYAAISGSWIPQFSNKFELMNNSRAG